MDLSTITPGHILNVAFAAAILTWLCFLSRRLSRQDLLVNELMRDAAEVAMLLSRPEWVVSREEFFNQEESEWLRDDIFDVVPGVRVPGTEGGDRGFFTGPIVRDLLRKEEWATPGTLVRFSIWQEPEAGRRLNRLVRCERAGPVVTLAA